MRTLLVLLLVPSLALADDAKLKTRIVVGGETAAARAAFGDAVRAKLDACWTKPARMKAKLTFDGGKVSGVELTENADAATAVCVTTALRTATLAGAPAQVIATVELTAEAEAPQPKVGLFKNRDRKVLENIIDRSNTTSLGKFRGIKGGDTPKVVVGPNESLEGGLASDQINRVIRSRAGVFRACYQKELDRSPKLAGKVVIRFEIDKDGSVRKAAVTSSTLTSKPVETCLVSNVMRLRFPAAETTAIVNYPFVFSQAG